MSCCRNSCLKSTTWHDATCTRPKPVSVSLFFFLLIRITETSILRHLKITNDTGTFFFFYFLFFSFSRVECQVWISSFASSALQLDNLSSAYQRTSNRCGLSQHRERNSLSQQVEHERCPLICLSNSVISPPCLSCLSFPGCKHQGLVVYSVSSLCFHSPFLGCCDRVRPKLFCLNGAIRRRLLCEG